MRCTPLYNAGGSVSASIVFAPIRIPDPTPAQGETTYRDATGYRVDLATLAASWLGRLEKRSGRVFKGVTRIRTSRSESVAVSGDTDPGGEEVRHTSETPDLHAPERPSRSRTADKAPRNNNPGHP